MRIAVEGRAPLSGDYFPSGNGNALLSAIAASLLTDHPTQLHRVPNTPRTEQMLAIAQALGATVTYEGDTLTLQTPHLQTRTLDNELTNQLGASVLFLAPVIARRRHARLEWIGPLNRLHTHLTALRDLGQEIEIEGDAINIVGSTWDEQTIILTEMSVTATALVCMLAAVLGTKTIIYNAASEPHLRTLQHQLVQMGAQIEGVGSNLLTIHGMGSAPKASNIAIPPDHIEIASIAAIAAITPGQVAIHDVPLADLRMILKVYERLGVDYFLQSPSDDSALHTLHVPEQAGTRVRRAEDSDLVVDTSPWPGFPSDLVAIATVLATQSRGSTMIHEKLYNDRLIFIDKLKGMGAQILLCDPHRAVVIGKSDLKAEYIDTPDLRIGLGMFAAALCAQGRSIIDNAQVIDYVFENAIGKLIGLNAAIEVIAE